MNDKNHDGLTILNSGYRYDVDKIDDELGIITEHDVTLVHDRRRGELLIQQEREPSLENDTITNALDDLETAADYVEQDGTEYDADMIRACVDTLREELQE